MKVYKEASQYGIDGGRISKLMIKVGDTVTANYDRGWDVRPSDDTSQKALAILLHDYNRATTRTILCTAHGDVCGVLISTHEGDDILNLSHDKKLLMAVGKSRMAKHWQNREMLWSELLEKLSTTTRTRESVAEYAAMSKEERNGCKDVGGFVAGYLKGGRRNNASVVNRCAVCLDADSADPGLLDDLDMTFINAYALYSTHSHTPEHMRLRLIIPLSRTVTPDEYAAVARRIASDLTLTRFDPTTFEAARLMYWPSTPEDGEYVFRYEDAPFLDPDTVLSSYADWKDTSLWPTTQPIEERLHGAARKAEDPLEKSGIIGAFCRAHSITELMDTLLSSTTRQPC